MTPQEEAKYLIDKMGILGAKRQAQEEFGNAEKGAKEYHKAISNDFKFANGN